MKNTQIIIKPIVEMIAVVITVLFGALIWGTITFWCWNWLMPAIFGLPHITWIQAWGLSVLGNCLFPKINIKNTTSKTSKEYERPQDIRR